MCIHHVIIIHLNEMIQEEEGGEICSFAVTHGHDYDPTFYQ